jgi:NCAIR mutase (PurE)-related protein
VTRVNLACDDKVDASDLVNQVVRSQGFGELPPKINDVIDRHRQTLLNLATALIQAGRGEDEVVSILEKASESFSIALKTKAEGLQS